MFVVEVGLMGDITVNMTPERYAAWTAALSVARKKEWADPRRRAVMAAAIRAAWEDPLRIVLRRRKRCARGHDFEPDNFYERNDGRRRCRACYLVYIKARRARRKLRCSG